MAPPPWFHDATLVAASHDNGILRLTIDHASDDDDRGLLLCLDASDRVSAHLTERLDAYDWAAILQLNVYAAGIELLVYWERMADRARDFEAVHIPCASATWHGLSEHTLFVRRLVADPRNVPGDFYVEDGCCTQCGVPEVTAPELFEMDDDGCWVKCQPRTPAELDRMIDTLRNADLGCIRWRGTDDALRTRLLEADLGREIDD